MTARLPRREIRLRRSGAPGAEVINIVNNFFYARLTGMPAIKLYMEGFQPQ